MMASRALDREADLWDAAGITSNAAVFDLGCGPGIFLPEPASRTAPAGRLVGVDESGPAVTAARQLAGQIDQLDLGLRIQIVQAQAHATGLAPDTFDVVLIRNLLPTTAPPPAPSSSTVTSCSGPEAICSARKRTSPGCRADHATSSS